MHDLVSSWWFSHSIGINDQTALPTCSSGTSCCCLDCSVCSGSRREPSMEAAPEGADGAAESALELAAPAQTGCNQGLYGFAPRQHATNLVSGLT